MAIWNGLETQPMGVCKWESGVWRTPHKTVGWIYVFPGDESIKADVESTSWFLSSCSSKILMFPKNVSKRSMLIPRRSRSGMTVPCPSPCEPYLFSLHDCENFSEKYKSPVCIAFSNHRTTPSMNVPKNSHSVQFMGDSNSNQHRKSKLGGKSFMAVRLCKSSPPNAYHKNIHVYAPMSGPSTIKYLVSFTHPSFLNPSNP